MHTFAEVALTYSKMKLFGLIGYPLKNSFSKDYFRNKFEEYDLDYTYENFPIEDISAIKNLIEIHDDLVGLSVTIPHKETVIPYLDEIDPVASEIGAVNCIKIVRDHGKIKLIGYNTDAYGFEVSLVNFLSNHINQKPNTFVFGSGGAAKAVCYVLKKLKIPFKQLSRKIVEANQINYSEITDEIIKNNFLLINCTPIGMFPYENEILPLPFESLTDKHYCYDLIYFPPLTRFLKTASNNGAHTKNGLQLLYLQAEKSFEIWEQNS